MVTLGGSRLEMPPISRGIGVLMGINVGMFVVNMLAVGRLIPWLGLTWGGLGEFYGLGVLRLITYQFVHSYGNPWHLIWNLVSLYIFGGIVEGVLRTKRVVRLYLECGVAGGLLELLLAWMFEIDLPMVGASGACYGIMLYATCLAPNMRFLFNIPLWIITTVLCLVALYNIHLQFVLHAVSGVADGAHLGGALWGAASYKLHRTRTFFDSWRDGFVRWRRQRDWARDQQREASLDQVLTKVKEQGLASLTGAERKLLDRASKELRRR